MSSYTHIGTHICTKTWQLGWCSQYND